MSLTKLVDGRRVTLTPQEEAQRIADWAQHTPSPPPDLVGDFFANPPLEALLEVLAERFSLTPAALIAQIRSKIGAGPP